MQKLPSGTELAAAAALCCGVIGDGMAEVRLPAIFGSHMVLQQEKPVTVWGWAQPGETVTVQIASSKAEATATPRGEWRITLPPMKAGGPLEMTVTGPNTIRFDDIMVGEVWLCSGQSNMEMGVGACNNAEQEIREANHPGIRFFAVPETVSAKLESDVKAKWEVCTSASINKANEPNCPAAGYFFARRIHKELGVPVGIIGSSWGGTRIEPWTPPEGFAMVPELHQISERILQANPHTPQHKTAMTSYLAEVEAWVASARKALEEQKPAPPMPGFPETLKPLDQTHLPTAIYNAMIHPLIPFALRGFLWYQGEGNHWETSGYPERQRALVGGWRKLWSDDTLPFYYVQVAPFDYGEDQNNPGLLAEFWEQQTQCLSVPNSEMVVTNDISDLKDIHPKNKQDVGARLALVALAKTYGRKNLVCCGPRFKSLRIENDKARVTFTETGSGLASRDGKPLTWFELADARDGKFVRAEASIDGDSVVVSSPSVKNPTAVRFAWSMRAEPNLMNKEGLPASAFRAGSTK